MLFIAPSFSTFAVYNTIWTTMVWIFWNHRFWIYGIRFMKVILCIFCNLYLQPLNYISYVNWDHFLQMTLCHKHLHNAISFHLQKKQDFLIEQRHENSNADKLSRLTMSQCFYNAEIGFTHRQNNEYKTWRNWQKYTAKILNKSVTKL